MRSRSGQRCGKSALHTRGGLIVKFAADYAIDEGLVFLTIHVRKVVGKLSGNGKFALSGSTSLGTSGSCHSQGSSPTMRMGPEYGDSETPRAPKIRSVTSQSLSPN
jgi:hypothetical protein